MAGTLAHRDQENLIHSHQTAAASKPLNQGVAQGLAPKTPGAKIPTKAPATGKATGRRNNDDENAPLRGGKAGNLDKKNAFVTPAATRDQRAPLGAKTTNAKARAFQTPAQQTIPRPLQQKSVNQQRSTTARKPKLKIHQQPTPAHFILDATPKSPPATETQDPTAAAQPEEAATSDSEPDIEYCPPRPASLPDEPDFPDFEFTEGKKFPSFEPQNYFRNVFQVYREKVDPPGEDGLTRAQRQEKERDEAFERRMDAKLARRAERAWDPEWDFLRDPRSDSEGEGEEKKAVRALGGTASGPVSRSGKTFGGKRFAAPTAASKAKGAKEIPQEGKPVKSKLQGTAASRSTIGYSQGRKVSSTLRNGRDGKSGSGRTMSQPDVTKKQNEHTLDNLLGRAGEEQDPLDGEDFRNALGFEDGVKSIDDLFLEQDVSEVLLEVPNVED